MRFHLNLFQLENTTVCVNEKLKHTPLKNRERNFPSKKKEKRLINLSPKKNKGIWTTKGISNINYYSYHLKLTKNLKPKGSSKNT